MALGKFIKDNAKEGINTMYGGKAGLIFGPLAIAQIAQANDKLKETVKLVLEAAAINFTWPIQLIGLLVGVRSAIKGIIRDTGALEAALQRAAQVKGLQRIFTGLLGSIDAAKGKVAQFYSLAAKTPFNVGQWAAAGKSLEVFTNGAFTGSDALKLIGDTAAGTGNELQDVASIVGALNAELRNGTPIAQTADELKAMGIVTSDVSARMVRMQQEGVSMNQVWSVMTEEMNRNKGAMEAKMTDIDRLREAQEKAREEFAIKAGEPFAKAEGEAIATTTNLIVAFTPAIQTLTSSIAGLVNPFSNLVQQFTLWIATSGAGKSVILSVATAMGLLFKATIGVAGVYAIKLFGPWIGLLRTLYTTLMTATSATRSFGQAQLYAELTARALANGEMRVAASYAALSAEAGLAAGATAAFSGACRLASFAIQGLLKLTGIGVALVALGGLISTAVEKFGDWQRGMTEAEQAGAALRAESNRIIDSLTEQGNAIQTTEDQLKAMADAYAVAAAAHKAYIEAKEKVEHPTGTANTLATKGRQALTDLPKDASGFEKMVAGLKFVVGNELGKLMGADKGGANPVDVRTMQEQKSLEDRALARKAIASEAPVGETEAERARREAAFRRSKSEQEAQYDRVMTFGSHSTQLEARQGKIGQLEGRVTAGREAIDTRAKLSGLERAAAKAALDLRNAPEGADKNLLRSDLLAKQEALRGEKSKGPKGFQAESDLERIEAALSANQLSEKIKNAGAATEEQSTRLSELQATAYKFGGKSTADLLEARDKASNVRDHAKEIEGNYGENLRELGAKRSEQAQAFFEGQAPVATSLGRAGLGGLVGDKDPSMYLKEHSQLLKDIRDSLRGLGLNPNGQAKIQPNQFEEIY